MTQGRNASRTVGKVAPKSVQDMSLEDFHRQGAALFYTDPKQSMAAFMRVLERQPDDLLALNQLGQQLLRAGQHQAAEAIFRKALATARAKKDVLWEKRTQENIGKAVVLTSQAHAPEAPHVRPQAAVHATAPMGNTSQHARVPHQQRQAHQTPSPDENGRANVDPSICNPSLGDTRTGLPPARPRLRVREANANAAASIEIDSQTRRSRVPISGESQNGGSDGTVALETSGAIVPQRLGERRPVALQQIRQPPGTQLKMVAMLGMFAVLLGGSGLFIANRLMSGTTEPTPETTASLNGSQTLRASTTNPDTTTDEVRHAPPRKFESTTDRIKKVTPLLPSDPFERGKVLEKNSPRKALAAYREAVKINPENPRAWHRLGALSLKLDDLDTATEAYEELMAQGEKKENKAVRALAANGLSEIAFRKRELEHAGDLKKMEIGLLEEIGETTHASKAYGRLGYIAMRRNQIQEAEQHYLKSIELAQQSGANEVAAYQYSLLGELRTREGKIDEACTYWRQAQTLFEQSQRGDLAKSMATLIAEAGCSTG